MYRSGFEIDDDEPQPSTSRRSKRIQHQRETRSKKIKTEPMSELAIKEEIISCYWD